MSDIVVSGAWNGVMVSLKAQCRLSRVYDDRGWKPLPLKEIHPTTMPE
jgi:hypothetical protein